MESYIRPLQYIKDDIEERLDNLKSDEELIIKISKDCVENTYIYNRYSPTKPNKSVVSPNSPLHELWDNPIDEEVWDETQNKPKTK